MEYILAHAMAEGGMGVAISDASQPMGAMLYADSILCAIMALEQEELLGRPHPFLDEGNPSSAPLNAALESGRRYSGTIPFVRKDGIPAWCMVHVLPGIFPAQGPPVYVWLHQDVSPQVAIEEMWSRYEFIANASHELMGLVSADFQYEALNVSCARAHGGAIDDFAGKPLRALWGPEAFDAIWKPCLERVLEGGTVQQQSWFELPGIGYRCLDIGFYPYEGPDGVARRVAFVAHDVTEQRQAEDTVRQLNTELEQRVAMRTEELRQAMKDLESFSYSVAHDLRAPLGFIRTFTEMATELIRDDAPDEQRRYLRFISEGVSQMTQLINDLLAFAKTGRQQLQRRQVDMASLAKEVLGELLPLEHGRRIESRIDDMPPCMGDSSLLRQVLANLFSNALKFTRTREVARIHFGYHTLPGGACAYFVQDNGIGFEQSRAGELFQVFRRLHTDDRYEGTGVGLAMVQRIIERHGGAVRAEGKPDKGACILFELDPPDTVELY